MKKEIGNMSFVRTLYVRVIFLRVSTFKFTVWIFYGSHLKVSGRKKRNWNEDVDKTESKC